MPELTNVHFLVKHPAVLTILVIVHLAAVIYTGCSAPPPAGTSPEPSSLKVISYNVNWGMPDPQGIADFLAQADADIVCLQETHTDWERLLKDRLQDRYQFCIFQNWGTAGGMAIMSKYPLHNAKLIEPEAGWFPPSWSRLRRQSALFNSSTFTSGRPCPREVGPICPPFIRPRRYA